MEGASELIVQGFQLLNEGRYSDSISKFEKAIKADPDNPEAYFGKAEAGMISPEVSGEEVKEQFEKAIELDPENPFYRSSQGAFCVELGEFNEAESCYMKAAELDPDNKADYYSEFAVSYYKRAPEIMEHLLDDQGMMIIKRKALNYLLKSIDMDIEEAKEMLCD